MNDFGAYRASPKRHAVLRRLVAELPQRNTLRVLEVGSYLGESALVWREALEARIVGAGCTLRASVLCVDPWEPYHAQVDLAAGAVYAEMDSLMRSGDALRRFLENTASESSPVPIHALRAQFSAVAPLLVQGGFDLVYIDGNHSYSVVREDINAAFHLVRLGGTICGDDLEVQLDECDEAFARAHAERDYVMDPLTQRHFHPGVTIAVGEAFGDEVTVEEGVWWMRA